MQDDLPDRVVTFVGSVTHARADRLRLDAELAKDLGMDGMDAYELLEAFAKEFNVDMAGFEFERYFGPEGIDPVDLIKKAFGKGNYRQEPIRIEHLVRVASAGRWSDPS